MGVEYTCDRCGQKMKPKDLDTFSVAFDDFGEAFGHLKKPILCNQCKGEFERAYKKFLGVFLEQKPKRFLVSRIKRK